MTLDELRSLTGGRPAGEPSPSNKYHAKRVGGHDSKKEHYRAFQLYQLQKAGAISDLREQVPFTLIPAQFAPDGSLLERPCRYIADFVYTDPSSGLTIVEDTKGFRTGAYIIKRKLMLSVHGIRIKEV